MFRIHNRGQTVIEYTILVIIVLGAFLTVGTYVKRGIQGRWKQTADDLGDQYDPRFANSNVRYVFESNTHTEVITVPGPSGFFTTRTDETNSLERRTGHVTIEAE
jgi:Flp pilus assembly pilin Flp